MVTDFHSKNYFLNYRFISVLYIGIFLSLNCLAQKQDSVRKSFIQTLENDYAEFFLEHNFQKLIGNVKLLHGTDTLYCDSAYLYQDKNMAEAWGDVLIKQLDGTEAIADYMRYNGSTKTVFLSGNVTLTDNKQNDLWSEELDYNLATKIGRYFKGGTLLSENTLLTSKEGSYNLKTKDARFKIDVQVEDPEYFTTSSDLGYNTDTKIVTFFGPSVVTNDQSILQTSSGYYDTKIRTSHFNQRSSIFNDGLYIEADTLDYDRNTGYGVGLGNAIIIDTANKATLYCGHAQYNEISKVMYAFVQPVLKVIDQDDSLYLRADTFFSEPITADSLTQMNTLDSIELTVNEIKSAVSDSVSAEEENMPVESDSFIVINDTTDLLINDYPGSPQSRLDSFKSKMDSMVYHNPQNDSLQPDTLKESENENNTDTAISRKSFAYIKGSEQAHYRYQSNKTDSNEKRYFIGYKNALIYADSLQGKCDSIYYSQSDSIIKMMLQPLLWASNSMIKGDIILLKLDSNKLKELFVPKDAILVSRSGPEQADMFDQIQGNTLKAYLTNNKIDSLVAQPNASNIYFIKDEEDAYVGSSEATSERIEIFFEEEKIKTINYRKDFEQTMTPMQDVEPSSLRLSRFAWDEEQRPKTLEEFLKGTQLIYPELW